MAATWWTLFTNESSSVKSPVDNKWHYRTTDATAETQGSAEPPNTSPTSHMLVSLLSLLGEGFEGSLAAFPLAEAAVSGPAAAAVTERLVCSSLRASGLGCAGGTCSAGGWTVSSCCSLWLCRRRSWTRSSKMASCSSWMAWFRWVFLFYRETKYRKVGFILIFFWLFLVLTAALQQSYVFWFLKFYYATFYVATGLAPVAD